MSRPEDRLSRERERELVAATEVGDARACAELVSAFTPAIAGIDRLLERIRCDGIHELSAALDERERTVVFSHYGLGRPARTFREIAAEIGRSAERVRKIEEDALGSCASPRAGCRPITAGAVRKIVRVGAQRRE